MWEHRRAQLTMAFKQESKRLRVGRRKSVLLMAFALFWFLSFMALGVWQIERRKDKLALIAAVEQRVHNAPVPAPGPAAWPRITFRTDSYRAVSVSGVFLHDRETLVQAVTERGPGYWIMTPLRTDANWTVLVNRGFVDPENSARSARRPGEPQGRVRIVGLLRITEPKGGFLRSNDPSQDRWYSRDVAAIGRARHLSALAPYFIDAGPTANGKRQPVGGLTILSFPNNHLQYAITWFGLAGLALFAFVRVARGGTPPSVSHDVDKGRSKESGRRPS
jgi:surfeit locus 1 family protein